MSGVRCFLVIMIHRSQQSCEVEEIGWKVDCFQRCVSWLRRKMYKRSKKASVLEAGF